MSWIAVCPVSFSVPAALTPWSTKKVASVTMKLGSFVFTTVMPLMKPIARPNSEHDRHRRPDVHVRVGREVAEQQARAADHHAGGEVELAADHQQRDRHGDDPVLRGLVGPARGDRRVADPVDRAGEVREGEEHARRAPRNAPMSGRREAA